MQPLDKHGRLKAVSLNICRTVSCSACDLSLRFELNTIYSCHSDNLVEYLSKQVAFVFPGADASKEQQN